MNFKILKTFATTVFFIFIFVHFIHSQEAQKLRTKLALFVPINISMGQNVYAQAHQSTWFGLGLTGQTDITRNLFIGFEFSNAVSSVNQKEIINSEKSTLSNATFIAGYKYGEFYHMDIDVYGLIGGTKGNNQGEFNGYHYGLGVKASKYFHKNLFLFLGSDIQKFGFDIEASPYWKPRFNQAIMFRLSLGAGFSF